MNDMVETLIQAASRRRPPPQQDTTQTYVRLAEIRAARGEYPAPDPSQPAVRGLRGRLRRLRDRLRWHPRRSDT